MELVILALANPESIDLHTHPALGPQYLFEARFLGPLGYYYQRVRAHHGVEAVVLLEPVVAAWRSGFALYHVRRGNLRVVGCWNELRRRAGLIFWDWACMLRCYQTCMSRCCWTLTPGCCWRFMLRFKDFL
jgi:hypothetical protein